MNPEPVVAIAGATGLVGREMIAVLNQLNFPYSELKLFASEQSAGELIQSGEDEVEVEVLGEDSFEGVDIALFATDAKLSAKFAPIAAKAGAYAIDNSSHFRMDPEIPLIVPEVNSQAWNKDHRIIANPNCSTIQLAVILNVIEKAAGLERVVVATYQSVSGAGKSALDELWEQSLAIFNQREIISRHFSHQIAFNCIPHIDTFMTDGYTKEEWKVMNESRKILGLTDLKIVCTAVRVPVFHSHAEVVNVETKKPLAPDALAKLLETAPGVELFPAHDIYPLQIGAAGGDSVQVGRIRRDPSVENGLVLWIVADNLRKGAALNAVQIAQMVLEKSA